MSIYKFGRTTTLPDKEDNYLPKSPYEVVEKNLENNFHTLMLIDPGLGLNRTYNILEELEEEKSGGIFVSGRKIFLLCRAGNPDSYIYYGDFEDLNEKDHHLEPPFAVLIPSEMSHQEEKFARQFL